MAAQRYKISLQESAVKEANVSYHEKRNFISPSGMVM